MPLVQRLDNTEQCQAQPVDVVIVTFVALTGL